MSSWIYSDQSNWSAESWLHRTPRMDLEIKPLILVQARSVSQNAAEISQRKSKLETVTQEVGSAFSGTLSHIASKTYNHSYTSFAAFKFFSWTCACCIILFSSADQDLQSFTAIVVLQCFYTLLLATALFWALEVGDLTPENPDLLCRHWGPQASRECREDLWQGPEQAD